MRILIHDKKNYIYRLVKSNLKDFDFEVIKSIRIQFNKSNIESFDMIFFVFYNDFNIIEFLDFYRVNKNIVVFYEDSKVVERIINSQSAFYCINLNLNKGEIISIIKQTINLNEFLYNRQA